MTQEPDQRCDSGVGVLLSDVVGDKRINAFASLARTVESISRRVDDPRQRSIILSPLNSALEALPRKPWEAAADYSEFGPDAYDGDGGRDRATNNIRRFVERHVVSLPAQGWTQGQKIKPIGQDTLIWWEADSGDKRKIQPDGILVKDIISTATNGEIWVLDGVLGTS